MDHLYQVDTEFWEMKNAHTHTHTHTHTQVDTKFWEIKKAFQGLDPSSKGTISEKEFVALMRSA